MKGIIAKITSGIASAVRSFGRAVASFFDEDENNLWKWLSRYSAYSNAENYSASTYGNTSYPSDFSFPKIPYKVIGTLLAAASVGAGAMLVTTSLPWAVLIFAGSSIGFSLTNPKSERGFRAAAFGAAARIITSPLPNTVKDIAVPFAKKSSDTIAALQSAREDIINWSRKTWRNVPRLQKIIVASGFMTGAALPSLATPLTTHIMLSSDAVQAQNFQPVKSDRFDAIGEVIKALPQSPVTVEKPDVIIVNPTSLSSDNFVAPFAGDVKWRVSSGFGWRSRPWVENHPGIDLAAPMGTPIHETHGGKVIFSGWYRGYGNVVEVQTDTPDGPINEVYGHMKKRLVETGDTVNESQVIGLVGCTGLCTGPHLHYEFDDPNGYKRGHKFGRPINPLEINNVRLVLASAGNGPSLG